LLVGGCFDCLLAVHMVVQMVVQMVVAGGYWFAAPSLPLRTIDAAGYSLLSIL
jgi:hypothetical protein